MSERICHEDECGLKIPMYARADALYCCNACRQKAYRESKRRRDRFFREYGSWEAFYKQVVEPTVTAGRFIIRNAEGEHHGQHQ